MAFSCGVEMRGPACRETEIDDATFEANAQTIFDQAENRLHGQKAILVRCLGGEV